MNPPKNIRDLRVHPYPLLLIVTGLPCSGKTTVARKIAAELGLPLLTKDDIKERLFDTLGWSDRNWSRKLGGATYELLYYVIETMLASGISLAVESNFPPLETQERLRKIKEKTSFRAAIIECVAQSDVLQERWRHRAERGSRHPGHNDAAALEEFLAHIDAHTGSDGYGRLGVPEIGAQVCWVDTSFQVEWNALFAQIRASLGRLHENNSPGPS
jgi:predicted kinase